MGQQGAGKSSARWNVSVKPKSVIDSIMQFIEAAAGKNSGHALELSTKDVQLVSGPYPKGGRQVFFVDTPSLHEELEGALAWIDPQKQIETWINT
jgi:hypothetical protein